MDCFHLFNSNKKCWLTVLFFAVLCGHVLSVQQIDYSLGNATLEHVFDYYYEQDSSGSCLNDCFSQWDQGVCSNGTCECSYLYQGDDCYVNWDPIIGLNWDWMECNGGRYYPPVWETGDRRFCLCPYGWEGIECSICMSDSSCQQLYGSNSTCDRSVLLHEKKSYNCSVTDPEIQSFLGGSGAVLTYCDFSPEVLGENNGYGVCSLRFYLRDTGSPLLFNCSFSECQSHVDSELTQAIQCEKTQCDCSDWCNSELNSTIYSCSTIADFTCANSTGDCVFYQKELSDFIPYIPLFCDASECLSNGTNRIYVLPNPNTKRIVKMFLYSGLSIVVAFVLGAICQNQLRQYRERDISRNPLPHIEATLTFNNLNCVLPAKKSLFSKHATTPSRTVLRNVSGVFTPGKVTALLGASGAGKTTFIDILAGRKNTGIVTGDILINGEPRNQAFKRISGYVTQDDVFLGTLTVREQLEYTALMRLPSWMPYHEKMLRVDEVMEELHISHIGNSRIGTQTTRGISGGEKKRLNVAVELLIDPSILFLDEPTSGLDSYTASSLVRTLTDLAHSNKKRTVIMSLHQPRSDIYAMFDFVMVMSNGKLEYNGPANLAIDYFTKCGFPCPAHYNPADFLIDTVASPEWKGRRSSRVNSPIFNAFEFSHKTNKPRFNGDVVHGISYASLNREGSSHNDTNSNTDHNNNDNDHNHNHNEDNHHTNNNNNNDDNNNNHHSQNLIKSITEEYLNESGINDNTVPMASPLKFPSTLIQDIEEENDEDDDDDTVSPQNLVPITSLDNIEEYASTFWTQLSVLMRRTFIHSLRNPYLLRVQYVTCIVVGIALGLLFWHVPDDFKKGGAQNRVGFFFFLSCLLCFSSISCVDLFFSERLIFLRERANGTYRSSAYLMSKLISDMIPMRMIPPVILGSICYYMIHFQASPSHFLYFLLGMILLVTNSTSMCMMISAFTPAVSVGNLIAILSLFFFLLFSGFVINSTSLPGYLQWVPDISLIACGFQMLMINEFSGLTIIFDYNGQYTVVDGDTLLSDFGINPNNFFLFIEILVAYFFFFIAATYILLGFVIKEKR